MKRRPTDERSILYWRSAITTESSEHVLIDPNHDNGSDSLALGEAVPNPEGRLIAYTLRQNGGDEATLFVKNVETGNDLAGEVIDGAKYANPSWMPDGSGFVYTYLPPANLDDPQDRPGLAVVRYHKLGIDPKNDPVLHSATGDATKLISANISRDGKWLFLEQQNGWDKNDLYYQPINAEPTATMAQGWMPIASGELYLYSIESWKDEAYILTNEGAPCYRLFKVNLNDPQRSRWQEIIPESSKRILQSVAVIGSRLVVNELVNVTSQVEIYDLDGKQIRKLALPALGSVSRIEGDPDHTEIYYDFTNFTTPLEIFKTSVANTVQTCWGRIQIPVDPTPYVVEQKFFASKDGTQVPMFIVHRKDMPLNGRTPFLLHGYGGFGLSQTPLFSSGLYPWLEAGGGYALVNLRGGGEFGEKWHKDGMLLKKKNAFDDCISAAEYLIDHGYTKPQRLGLRGGSNGGLLVGAVLTQRPDLFRAAVCESPLLDMIRYAKFDSGATWIPEYGSPENPEEFKALYAYSPYHHVVPGTAYPSVLFCTAANDDRVDPMHARKMVAALQAATSSPNPILLRIESRSGHHGGKQISKTIEHASDLWGFLIHELGPFPQTKPKTPL